MLMRNTFLAKKNKNKNMIKGWIKLNPKKVKKLRKLFKKK